MSAGRRIKAALVACCLTYGLYQAGRAFFHPRQGLDLAPNYVAGDMLRRADAERIYDQAALLERARALGLPDLASPDRPALRYAYAPWLLPVYAPLSRLPWEAARRVWFVIGLAASLGAAVLLGLTLARTEAAVPRSSAHWVLFALAVTCVWFPTAYGLMGGQANDLPLLALAGSLFLLASGRPFLAGVLLAPAGAWKLFTGLPVLFLIARREMRALAGVAAGCAGLFVLSLPFTGLHLWQEWFHVLGGAYTTPQASARNGSIAGAMLALFSRNSFVVPLADIPGFARAATLGLQIVAAIATLLALRAAARRGTPQFLLQFAAPLVLGLLLTPMSWDHYGVFLLPAFLAAFACDWSRAEARAEPPGARKSRGIPGVGVSVILGLSFGIWAFVLQLGEEYAALAQHRWGAAVAPVKMAATFALLGASAWLCLRGLEFRAQRRQEQ